MRSCEMTPRATSWIVQDTEMCEHCGQTYAYELERYCIECDAPICPLCVVIAREEVRCPAHVAGDAAE